MTPSIAHLLEAARAGITSFTGMNVTLGLPDDSASGLYIFAYKFAEDPVHRNINPEATQAVADRPICLYCLLMASPWNDYATLDMGLRCMTEQPLLKSNRGTVRIKIVDISTQDLSLIFKITHTTYRLAIPFQLQGT